MSGRINHNPTIVEARAALPLSGGVKCRHPVRVKTELYRSVPGRAKTLGETGYLEET